MKYIHKLSNISKNESNFYKGIGILLIVLHNIYHWMWNSPGENEFNFNENRINLFFKYLGEQPLDFFNIILSYFGHYGVQIFFFISGYGLMKSYSNKNPKIIAFVWSRVKKIYPVFLLAIISYMAFMLTYKELSLDSFSYSSIFLKLTFLSNLFPHQALYLNGPWWFYSAIVQLYVLFPLLLRLRKKYGQISYLIILIINYIIIFVFFKYFAERGVSLYYQSIGQLPVFLAGMFLADKSKLRFNFLWLIPVFVVFTIGNYVREFWYFSNLMLIILIIPLFEFAKTRLNNNGKFYRFVIFYGKISMYLFATHAFFRPVFLKYTGSNILKNLLIIIVFLAFTTLFALFIKFIEKYLIISVNYLISAFSEFDKRFEAKSIFTKKIVVVFSKIVSFAISLMIAFTTLKIFEYYSVHIKHSFNLGGITKLLPSLADDLVLVLSITTLISIIFLIYLLSKNLGRIITTILFSIIILAYFVLIEYFKTTFIPLDHALLSYTFSDIKEIALSSAEVGLLSYIGIILVIFLIIGYLFISKHLKIGFSVFLIFLISGVLSIFAYNKIKPQFKDYDSVSKYYFSNNKLEYLVNNLIKNAKEDKNPNYTNLEIKENAEKWRSEFDFKYYKSVMYPFYRKDDTENVLEPFFDLNPEKKPNIVFIIVESLSSAYCSEQAYLGSFTPFLDSLRPHTLRWRNMLSTSERTFGVLPSTLASLPYSKEGIVNMGFSAPDHLSMLTFMQSWNYYTSFIHGGWHHFNKMDNYLDKNNINYRLDYFGEYDKIPANAKGFSWGYGDSVVFEKAKKIMDDSIAFQPYFSTYLTLSIHSPFNLHNQDYWIKKVHKRISEIHDDKQKREELMNNEKSLSTVMYMDNTLKRFFEYYKQRDDYQNTIFIITGDHRMGPINHKSSIDKYHVPFFIYSEMLNQSKEFGGISSHLDIAPSFLKLLSEKYKLEMPEYCQWLGTSLDTSSEFKAERIIPFMRNNKNIEELVYKNYFISNGKLFQIKDNMNIESIENDSISKKLTNILEAFKIINIYSTLNNKIIPLKDYLENMSSKLMLLKKISFDSDNLDDYYKKNLSKEHYNSLNKSVLINEKLKYAPIINTTEIDQDIIKIDLNLKFMARLEKKTDNKYPIIVINIVKENGKSILWTGDDVFSDDIKEGEWQSISYKTMIDISKYSKGKKFIKVYFWNNNDYEEIYYDDLDIKLYGLKE